MGGGYMFAVCGFGPFYVRFRGFQKLFLRFCDFQTFSSRFCGYRKTIAVCGFGQIYMRFCGIRAFHLRSCGINAFYLRFCGFLQFREGVLCFFFEKKKFCLFNLIHLSCPKPLKSLPNWLHHSFTSFNYWVCHSRNDWYEECHLPASSCSLKTFWYLCLNKSFPNNNAITPVFYKNHMMTWLYKKMTQKYS